MLGDTHPRFPLLYVAREDENGTPTAYGTKGPWASLGDPRLILRDRAGRILEHRPIRRNESGDILGTSNLLGADTETQSGCPAVR
jgi:hypothetical protein